MPYARISVPEGKPAGWIEAVSTGLHDALVATFDVPPGDRFQLFDPRPAGLRVFDRNYLAGPRSDDWILISITAGKPRSADAKRALYRDVADRLAVAPGIAPADVMIVIRTTDAEDWSFGDGRATMIDGPRTSLR